jgi:hypothetical protein
MNVEAIAQILEDGLSGLKIGKDIFFNHAPAGKTPCVLIKEPFAGTEIDWETPPYRKARFQVVVRARDYPTGRALAQQVSDVLTIGERDVPGMAIQHIRPRHEPVSYPVSEGDWIEFSVNFDSFYGIVQ